MKISNRSSVRFESWIQLKLSIFNFLRSQRDALTLTLKLKIENWKFQFQLNSIFKLDMYERIVVVFLLLLDKFDNKRNFWIRWLSRSTTNKFPKLSKAILCGKDNLSDVEPDDIEHATIQRKPFSSEPIIWLLPQSVMKRYLFPSKITCVG